MKKFILNVLLITALCDIANAQTKNVNLLEKDFGGLHFIYMKITEAGKTDARYLLTMSFRSTENAVKTITLASDDVFSQFTKDLANAVTQMDAGEDVDMSWERKNYTLAVMEKQTAVYLYAENKGGYLLLNKKNSDKLLEQVNRISFGSDYIAP